MCRADGLPGHRTAAVTRAAGMPTDETATAATVARMSGTPAYETGTVIADPATVRAILGDPRFGIPPVPSADPVGAERDMAWLRCHVSRFANGAAHARRRAFVLGRLDAIDPGQLREEARAETAGLLRGRAGSVDVEAEIARRVPLRVLGRALGIADDDRDRAVDAITWVAAAYHPGAGDAVTRRGDAGVAELVPLLSAAATHDEVDTDEQIAEPVPTLSTGVAHDRVGADERVANLVGILVQACDATAGLIRSAAAALPGPHTSEPGGHAADLVHAVLRSDPPVRVTRRHAFEDVDIAGTRVPAGSTVVVDLAAAGAPFGAGARPCPGVDHAIALASGVLAALGAWHRTDETIPNRPEVRSR